MIAILITGCSGAIQNTPTSVATLNLDVDQPEEGQTVDSSSSISGGVTASGVVKAAREAKIGCQIAGNLSSVDVKLGDVVQAGQILAVLAGGEQEQAALSNAEKMLIEANNQLDDFITQAAIASLQAQKEYFNTQDDLKDAKDRLTNLKYQRWLYQTKTKDQIKARERDLDAKFTNPTQANLDEAAVDVSLEEAKLADISKRVDSLKNGPDPEKLAYLEASVKNAKDQVAVAKVAIDNLSINAPFGGTISLVNATLGDVVSPGQILFILTDVSTLTIETTDLSERDVARVQPGQMVTVRFESLQTNVQGKVMVVSVRAETIGGDVVYPVAITLDSLPEGIRPGMSVDVDF